MLFGEHTNYKMVTAYDWDREKFRTFHAVKRHGLKTRGSDDFNIGVLKAGRLISFRWMEEPCEHDLYQVAEAISVKGPTKKQNEAFLIDCQLSEMKTMAVSSGEAN